MIEYRSADPKPSEACLLPRVRELLKDVPPGSVVLDLGCGNGSMISLFRDRGWKLFGADISPSGIEIARQNFPGIDFFVADASAATGNPLERAGAVDVIVCTEVIEHMYDPRSFLTNAFEVLKPGGFLILSTPYHGYLKNVILALTGRMDNHFTALWDHGHIKFWSWDTLSYLLEETGFEDVRFHGAGRIPYVWKNMILRATRP